MLCQNEIAVINNVLVLPLKDFEKIFQREYGEERKKEIAWEFNLSNHKNRRHLFRFSSIFQGITFN